MDAKLTLERIYPNQMDEAGPSATHSLELHMARYQFAARNCVGPRVLDIACGCGYGTALMAKEHPDLQFVGVDVDPQAVEYAKAHYARSNVHFFCASLLDLNVVDQFDTVVSLETIEHLPNPMETLSALARWVRPGGRLVGSVPVTPTMDGNPHHLCDFSARSFKRLLAQCGFQTGVELRQVQPWSLASSEADSRSQGGAGNIMRYYSRYPWRVGSRLWSMVRYGFNNHYLTAVAHKADVAGG